MTTRNTTFPTRIIAEIIIFVSLATALSLIKIYTLPQGGSITLGMVPLLWLAIRRGPKIGIFSGALFGCVDLAIEPYVVHPVQFLLDYPVAFAALGLAGFFQNLPEVGVVVGVTGRFVSHFVSGVVFFASFAPSGMSPIVYSAIYNGSYLLPDMIICMFIMFILNRSNVLKSYL